MRPRWTTPDPRIDAVRGCVALERGPLVMCAESTDLPGGRQVDVLEVDPTVEPRDRDDGSVLVGARLAEPADRAWPYEGVDGGDAWSGSAPESRVVDVALRPYHGWGNRGPSTMRVWIPRASGQSR
jgi:DUF1680 family protein